VMELQEWTEDEIWKVYNRLLKWGCDIPAARERFLEDDELYLKCLVRFRESPAYGKLKKYIALGDYTSAYEIAHLMKGTSATLEIIPVLERIVVPLSYLEKGKKPPEEAVEELYRSYEKFQELVPPIDIEEI